MNCTVIFTDASYKKEGKINGFIHAHCPYHKSRKGYFLYLVGLIPEWRGNYSKLWLFFHLRRKFDIVYSFFYSFENLKFASWVANHKNCKHVVHIADHSPSFFEQIEFKSILKSAYKHACIGHNMKDAYQKRFNINFEVFHNYVDYRNHLLPPIASFIFNKKNPLKILFLGTLFYQLHNGAINDICKTVKILGRQGYPISLNIYGQSVPTNFLENEVDNKFIFKCGKVSQDQRYEVMKKHHVFIVPSSFDKRTSDHYRYSIPTKLPELLASGRPTIVYGPNVMEAHRFCLENKCGIIIDKNLISEIKFLLIKIISEYKEEQSNAIKQAIRIEHLISRSIKVRRFQQFLNT